jgi:CRP/FNR family transcriptional regulator, cyclic AMP receptor protein
MTSQEIDAPDVRFLPALTQDEASSLRGRGTVRSYSRGSALFHERQISDRVVVILSGCVKLSRVSEVGTEVVFAIRDAGDLLGEQSAIDGEPRAATAIALEPVEALVVPTRDFIAFLEEKPRAALQITRMLSRRLRDADRKRFEFASQDSVGRVAARIVELAERFGSPVEGGVQIDLPISQEELAGWTGCSREAVSKALQTLRAPGWIETRRRHITVLDLEAVRRRGE